jgi:UDP-N-acetylmuramate--alanine ligase
MHFIAIGGVGMSGIALVLSQRGVHVTGSHLHESPYTRMLERAGIKVTIGHSASNVRRPDLVVTSSGVTSENPELLKSLELGIPVRSRAAMLAQIARGKKMLAVAGTHGKTSTSAMLAWTLAHMALSPMFVVGGMIRELEVNASDGSGEYCVVEADESDASFLELNPFLALIANLDTDHLDYYGSLDQLKSTFVEFARRVDSRGWIVICGDDPGLKDLSLADSERVTTYGFHTGNDVRCEDLGIDGFGHAFLTAFPDGQTVRSRTNIPGIHHVVNAAGVLAAAWRLGLDVSQAAAGLAQFPGVHRRFEVIGESAGVIVVDDYAHHPTEVSATITAARELRRPRVVGIFQPHRYSRTKSLAHEFGEALALADVLFITDVYGAGEPPAAGVSGQTLLDALPQRDPSTRASYVPNPADVTQAVSKEVREGDVVLVMGAGDCTSISRELLHELASRAGPD